MSGHGDRLPNIIIIGAMKCGTSALHDYLASHPEVSMAKGKEVDFFSRCWHRGVEWYASLFDPGAPVRGESSPGYTSPDFPCAAARMAHVVPAVRLVYLVRDPVTRAVSQYEHHVRDGAEPRTMQDALLDPTSQYLSRSRYYERVRPFLRHFPREQLLVVPQERLLANTASELRRVLAHIGADPAWSARLVARRHDNVAHSTPDIPRDLDDNLSWMLRDDVAQLRQLAGDSFPEWKR